MYFSFLQIGDVSSFFHLRINHRLMSSTSSSWLLLLLFIFTTTSAAAPQNSGGNTNINNDGVIGSSSSLLSPSHVGSSSGNSRCEEIAIPMCRGIGYNMTSMPNELNHDTQEEAGLEVHQFWPLVEIKCSPDLKFFLCSIYVPICIEDYFRPLPACRSVCERARDGCVPLMKQYGFPWPERMSCEKFPVHGNNQTLCMEQNNRTDSISTTLAPTTRPTKRPQLIPNQNQPCKPGKRGCGQSYSNGGTDCTCRCRHPLVPVQSQWRNNFTFTVGGVPNCGYPCRGVFLSQEERDFASVWLALWSGLCFVSTLTTLITFLIDTDRFRYPERPIVFLSACYCCVSLGYLVRVFLGHEAIACDGRLIRYATTPGPAVCTLVFLLVYFFGMASSIWWVILSLTWFLAAGLKWGNEAIAGYSQYFHLLAWLVPSVQSVLVLALQAVDGDPVAGICTVGNLDASNLRIFVLAPLLIYLLLGTSFLLGGFVALFRIRNVIRRQGKADKLEKLMIRIGVFSVLYTVPATVVIGCHVYETSLSEMWTRSLVCPCEDSATSSTSPMTKRPLYSVLMLKYFMALAVGITSGVWIWSGKTLDSWKRFWRRILGRGGGHNAAAAVCKQRQVCIQLFIKYFVSILVFQF